jgi:hypothetical protein
MDTREECHCSHTCKSFKRAGVETNGILEGKVLFENADRAWASVPLPSMGLVAKGIGC